MALDFDAFVARFPEFKRASKAQVEAKIAEAELQVDACVWGAKYDLGLGYLTAHLLSLSPEGRAARLVPANAKATREDALTTYERVYQRLVRTVASGARVVGTATVVEEP